MMKWIERYSPPGMSLGRLKTVFYAGLVIAGLYSMLFLADLLSMILELRRGVDNDAVYDMMLPSYYELLGMKLIGFEIAAVCVLPMVFFNYAYFSRDSKSWYLMRRVSSPWEIHIRCWTLPVLAAVCILLTAWVLYWLYCGIYFLVTPEEFLPDQVIPLIWRLLP